MQDDRVLVRVDADDHVADAGVPLADDPNALLLKLGLRRLDVVHAQREARDVRLELDAFLLRLPERQRHLARRQLVRVVRVLGEPEEVAVPRPGALGVTRRDVEEVDPLDVHWCGAYLRWSISELPSGSWKNAMWQTPVSSVSPSNSMPLPSSSERVSSTFGTRKAMYAECGALNSRPTFLRSIRQRLMFSPSWNSGQ